MHYDSFIYYINEFYFIFYNSDNMLYSNLTWTFIRYSYQNYTYLTTQLLKHPDLWLLWESYFIFQNISGGLQMFIIIIEVFSSIYRLHISRLPRSPPREQPWERIQVWPVKYLDCVIFHAYCIISESLAAHHGHLPSPQRIQYMFEHGYVWLSHGHPPMLARPVGIARHLRWRHCHHLHQMTMCEQT